MTIAAELIARQWRRVDVKLTLDGEMHVLRWRRGWLQDEVLFDDRRIAVARGLFSRDQVFGLALRTGEASEQRFLFTVDPENDWMDWSGEMRPRGVRLETAERLSSLSARWRRSARRLSAPSSTMR